MSAAYHAVVDSVGRDEWDAILDEFADASIFQTWSYGAIRWGEGALSHLVLERAGKVGAAAQVRIMRMPVLGVGIGYVKWGPLWRRRDGAPEPEIFSRMIDALREEYVGRRRLLLRVVPREVDDAAATLLAARGFRSGGAEPPYQTLVLDLERSVDELHAALKPQWRGGLRRAAAAGLSIEQGTGAATFRTLVALHDEMRARKRYVAFFDVEDDRRIQEDLPERFKMQTSVATVAGEPHAAIAVSRLGDTALCLLAATGDAGLDSNASYLLQWRMIEWLKQTGCRAYDLCGINRERNPGSYRFKAGLAGKGARPSSFVGSFDLCRHASSALAIGLGDRLRDGYRRARVDLASRRQHRVSAR